MAKDKKQELREVAASQMADPVITMAYLEHQMDLMGQLIIDLSDGVELPPEKAARLEMLKSVMQNSSVDFNDITNPLQSYKIPTMTEHKKQTRLIQYRYLQAQMREGLFGK